VTFYWIVYIALLVKGSILANLAEHETQVVFWFVTKVSATYLPLLLYCLHIVYALLFVIIFMSQYIANLTHAFIL